MQDIKPKRLLRRKEVEAKVGYARSSLYDAIKKGLFPSPINLSSRSVAWVEDDIDSWIADRIKQSKERKIPNTEIQEV